MRLLVVTQKVDRNDAILGFFHRWLIEFGKHWTEVRVICLEEGLHVLPENVSVLSLGKEKGGSRIQYAFRFLKYVVTKRGDYDVVLVHMNPIYLVLAGWFWRIARKPVGLWYVHGSVDIKLRIAHMFASKVFTAVKESFRLKSKKLHVLGHGIDIEQFICGPGKHSKELKLLVVGRIAKVKNNNVIVQAAKLLKDTYKISFQLVFVGAPLSEEDEHYFATLKDAVKDYQLSECVHFVGEVSYHEVAHYYCEADIVLNISSTGGLDKTVLEAMAAKRLVLSTYSGCADFFKPYDELLIPNENDPESLACKIKEVFEYDKKDIITNHLYDTVRSRFSVEKLVSSLSSHLKKTS